MWYTQSIQTQDLRISTSQGQIECSALRYREGILYIFKAHEFINNVFFFKYWNTQIYLPSCLPMDPVWSKGSMGSVQFHGKENCQEH